VNLNKEIGSTSAKGLTFSILGALLSVRYEFGKCRITSQYGKSCGRQPLQPVLSVIERSADIP
jgi:hypothetical protein